MTLFWFLAFVFALLVAVLVVLPLWRRTDDSGQNLLELNRRVFRERLAELEKDEAEGRLDADTLAELRLELERNMLVLDVAPDTAPASSRRLAGWLVLVLLPLLSLLFYWSFVAPQGLTDWWKLRSDMGPAVDRVLMGQAPTEEESRAHTLPDFIRVLQYRLQGDPKNADGWFMLGMSYVQLEMGEPALTAFEHAWRLNPDEPRYQLAYAQTRLYGNEGQLDPLSRQLLESVLEKNPEHEGAMVLLGFAAYRSGDYALAVSTLEKLQAQRQGRPDTGATTVMQQLTQTLASARAKLKGEGGVSKATAAAPSIRVRVQVDRKLAGKFAPDDVVYIFARALKGPPMPLAVVRRPAGELPFTVELDDSQSPMPTLKLSAVPEVAITARISRHGSPEAQPGDLEAIAVPVRQGSGAQSVDLLIQNVR
ncbi:MAG: c-type cytochrome biogenesis protein CcmI [Pedobacter sp.]|nr:c-type cytochrome biogenesis protein CcmI [Pedobacter sp.]